MIDKSPSACPQCAVFDTSTNVKPLGSVKLTMIDELQLLLSVTVNVYIPADNELMEVPTPPFDHE